MPLTKEQIVPGVIAYFDANVLNADGAVTLPASPTDRSGPFVCFAADSNRSAWAAITTQHRPERIEIKSEWRTGGKGAWLSADQYLNDGATTYVGPNESFVAAAATKDRFSGSDRPQVTVDGVSAVLLEITKRGGNLL